jgi:hypothetical protein
MGGGGGGGNGNGRRGEEVPPPRDFADCEAIRFETVLASPQQAVIASLLVGQVLLLRLGSQQNRPVVDAVTDAGDRAGSITSTHLTQLIECLQGGHDYVADVLDLDGGACRVLVHHSNH